jgi:hypothetical protein
MHKARQVGRDPVPMKGFTPDRFREGDTAVRPGKSGGGGGKDR